MRVFYLVAALLPALAVADEYSSNRKYSTPRSNPLVRRDDCSAFGQVACDNSCKPVDTVCCNDGSGTYCKAGTYCTIDGCCPIGEICSGPGGTSTIDFVISTTITNTVLRASGSGGASITSQSNAGATTRTVPVSGSTFPTTATLRGSGANSSASINISSNAGATTSAFGPIPAMAGHPMSIGAMPAMVAGAIAAGVAWL